MLQNAGECLALKQNYDFGVTVINAEFFVGGTLE
jgi:hypothetical protein